MHKQTFVFSSVLEVFLSLADRAAKWAKSEYSTVMYSTSQSIWQNCVPLSRTGMQTSVILFIIYLQTSHPDLCSHQPTTSSVLSTGHLLLRCINSMSPCQSPRQAKVIISSRSWFIIYYESTFLNLSSSVLRDTLLLIEKQSGLLPSSPLSPLDRLLQSTLAPHNKQEDPGLVAIHGSS